MAQHSQPELPESATVPGGFVTTELSKHAKSFFLLRIFAIGGYSASGLRRDIVVQDASGQEIYREGPYNEITVHRPMRRIVAEIRREGLEDWLRAERIENKQLGPVRAPTDRVTVWRLIAVEWQAFKNALLRLPKPRSTDERPE